MLAKTRRAGGASGEDPLLLRPWRLRWEPAPAGPESEPDEDAPMDEALARGLEDESYRRWRAARPTAPPLWRVDEAFSAVVHLTPAELTELAGTIRAALAAGPRRLRAFAAAAARGLPPPAYRASR